MSAAIDSIANKVYRNERLTLEDARQLWAHPNLAELGMLESIDWSVPVEGQRQVIPALMDELLARPFAGSPDASASSPASLALPFGVAALETGPGNPDEVATWVSMMPTGLLALIHHIHGGDFLRLDLVGALLALFYLLYRG